MRTEHYTFCHLCVEFCGIAVTVDDDGKIQKIRPDKANPYSWKGFCVKGANAHHILDHPNRLRSPLKRVGDRYVAASYEEAVDDVATRLKTIVDRYGPEAVGSYLGNPGAMMFGGSLFFDMLMMAMDSHNRFWVGSVDTNAFHAVAKEMYGSEWAILQTDMDACRFLILVGSNPAVSGLGWVDQAPGGWAWARNLKKVGGQLVVVDPRKTETAEHATLHIAPLPGTDWALLLAMTKVIFDKKLENRSQLERVNGVNRLRQMAAEYDLSHLGRICDVNVDIIRQLAINFASSGTGLVVARTGPGLGANATLCLWLAQVLNVVTGRMDQSGGCYYMTGILDLMKDVDRLFPSNIIPSRVRGIDTVAGYHHLAELPDEVMTPGNGEIKALLIYGGNPVISGPDAQAMDRALRKLDLLVAIDLMQRESHRHAHWLIPAAHFLEREEINPLLQSIHNQRYAQTSRQVVAKPETMRYEWEFFRDVALAMNLPLAGKTWLNPFIRGSRLLGRIKKDPYYSFSPRFIAWNLIRSESPMSWKDIMNAPHGLKMEKDHFGNFWDALQTDDKKIHLCPGAFCEALVRKLQEPEQRADKSAFPLLLISRRRKEIMNSWLIETSGKKIGDKAGHCIEVNYSDAEALKVKNGQMVTISSATGSLTGQVRLSDKVRSGVAAMGHGWGSRLYSPHDNAPPTLVGVNRNRLVSNKDLDPFSGVPQLNSTPVTLVPADEDGYEA